MNEADQATETTQPTEATRDDLLAAVREAGGTEVEQPAEQEAALEAPAATEQPVEEEPKIASILRAREKAREEQEAARSQAQRLIDEARAESERLMREARERADREFQAELQRRQKEFVQAPTDFLRKLGDPQEIVDAVLRDGTPEGRALRQLQQELAEAKGKASIAEDVKKQFEEFKQEQQRQAALAEVERVRSVFMGSHATPEKAPHLHARYDADEIFERANALAAQWRTAGLQLGKDFDYDTVVDYLEVDSKKRLAPILGSTPARQSGAGAPPPTAPGVASKSVANGPRTLSAAQGSERRASPKPLHEMTREEAREALIAEVAAARRALPGASS